VEDQRSVKEKTEMQKDDSGFVRMGGFIFRPEHVVSIQLRGESLTEVELVEVRFIDGSEHRWEDEDARRVASYLIDILPCAITVE
jgi:hypothetical protein